MTAESGKLIVTSSLGKSEETASPMVWDAVCESEADRDCIADWRSPIFLHRVIKGKSRTF